MNDHPLVSVVITTIRRPQIVLRACRSALAQTYTPIEVIVVIDGPDEATRQSLPTLQDDRVRVVALDSNVGLAQARNTGVDHAEGRWIAFLDDDDEWLENKIEEQVMEAERIGGERVFVTCQYIDKGPNFDRVLPYRSPEAGEPISEYLFCRKGALGRGGLLQPSTYFASRQLLVDVPFTPGLKPHEDFDWLMRAAKVADRPYSIVAKPLSIYNNQQTQTSRASGEGSFQFFWDYAHSHRDLFTPEAFSFYIAQYCIPPARPLGRRLAFLAKQIRGMNEGRLTPRCLLFALGHTVFQPESRRRIRHAISSALHPTQKTAL